jgi:hypothetical protein
VFVNKKIEIILIFFIFIDNLDILRTFSLVMYSYPVSAWQKSGSGSFGPVCSDTKSAASILVFFPFQTLIAYPIEKHGKFFGGCLQLLGCFHRNIHDPSALAADVVVMWGCIIIEMIRAVAAGQLPDLAQLN